MRFMKLLGAALFATGMAVTAAHAATEVPFTQQAFAESQKAGKAILVDIWAGWCPTCKAQAPVLSAIESDPANKDLVMYRVDFDSQKDVVKKLEARAQSTLIVFRGTTEKGRSVGDTDPASIKALVARAAQ